MSPSATAAAPRLDLARPEDDAELRALLRETPMGGRIRLTFRREPDFFAVERMQGPFAQVIVARAGGRIAGAATRAIRPTWVNGERVDAGYLGDLRLRPEFRGGTLLARGFRFLRELHADGRARVYATVIVADNAPALAVLPSGRAGLPRYRDLGRVLSPVLPLRRRLPEIAAEIVRGSRALLPEIVACLARHRMQLAPAYAEADFLDGRFPGFRVEEFYVLRRDGRVAGVLALWDQGAFRQTVVEGYSGWLGALRPLANLFLRPPLPPPGERLRFLYVTFAAGEADDYRALLRRAYNDAVGRGWTSLAVGLHERDPRAAAFAEYPQIPFAGRLFAITFDDAPALDDRVPYVEVSLL